jgi:REP element-mobilizing transposase RayT
MGKQQLHQPRKQIRLPDDAYRQGDPFILTVSTYKRASLFVHSEHATIALSAAVRAAAETSALLWCAIIMPDHAHMLISAEVGRSVLGTASSFKRLTTLGLRRAGFVGTVWQRRFHDRGIRTEFNSDVALAIEYIVNNPVRAGLVERWELWPHVYVNEEVFT